MKTVFGNATVIDGQGEAFHGFVVVDGEEILHVGRGEIRYPATGYEIVGPREYDPATRFFRLPRPPAVGRPRRSARAGSVRHGRALCVAIRAQCQTNDRGRHHHHTGLRLDQLRRFLGAPGSGARTDSRSPHGPVGQDYLHDGWPWVERGARGGRSRRRSQGRARAAAGRSGQRQADRDRRNPDAGHRNRQRPAHHRRAACRRRRGKEGGRHLGRSRAWRNRHKECGACRC